MNNQDWYLNQLGISQYVLRDPTTIKGLSSIAIADNIRLIVISQSRPNDKIFYDILKAINVIIDDCLIISPTQLTMPINSFNQVIWFIDEALPDHWLNTQEVEKKPIIQSASLSQLAMSPNLKRQLWNTLCQYENYFPSN